MKTKIKRLLRTYTPPKVYSAIYRGYQKINNQGLSKSKIEAYSRFTKRKFYQFKLEEVEFKILLDPNNGGVDSEIFSGGSYEPEILKIIKNALSAGARFLDIGANIGQHSLYASRFCAHVYSFEPIHRIYTQFNQSILENSISNISVFNYALGNEKKVVPIYGNDINMGASSILAANKKSKIQDVQVYRLDDVYNSIDIDRVDFIKIDVEGYELEVLEGAQNLIQKFKPTILLEYSPYLYGKIGTNISQKLINFLFNCGYGILDIGDGTTNQIKIEKIEDFGNTEQTNILCVYGKQ